MGKLDGLKRPSQMDKEKAYEALEKMGMADYANRQISQLSGGQQQRVFLARALVQDADLYFMDEPLAGVDAATERRIMNILKELRGLGKTVMVVHHDLQTVEDYFDHVLLLNRTVLKHGKNEQVFTKENILANLWWKYAVDGERRAVMWSILMSSNTQWVLFSTMILGIAAGTMGCLAYWKRQSLMSDALAHAAHSGCCSCVYSAW